jgi:hypothetical protein
LGVAADASSLGPTLAPRVSAFVRRETSLGSFGASLSFAQAYRHATLGGARLRWATAALEACPLRWRLGGSVAFVPCVPVEGGALVVDGDAVPGASTSARPWFSAGVSGRLEVALGARAFAELRAGAAAPIVRDTFYFQPATDVYQAPAVVGFAGIGAGMLFP